MCVSHAPFVFIYCRCTPDIYSAFVKYLREKGNKMKHQLCGGMDWINLDQDRDIWRALVKAVMNFRFHKM